MAPSHVAVAVVRSPARLAWAALTAFLLLGACLPPLRVVLREMPPLHDQLASGRDLIRYVLALTSPEDSVFDNRGEYIFRPHATYFYRLGRAIRMQLRSGVIRESDILHDLQRHHCKVAIFSAFLNNLPPTLRGFLRSHYVATGFSGQGRVVYVAGKVLRPTDLTGHRATVSLVASTEYAVRVAGGTPRVRIDGRVYQAPLFLAQGEHQFAVEGEFESLSIFYSRVLAVPFTRRDRPATLSPIALPMMQRGE